jgi:uncharacterized protein with FMN-binding domain
MRRAIATVSLTIAAVIFVLRFNPQTTVSFAAGSVTPGPGATSTPTAAGDSGSTTSTTTSTTQPSTTTTAPATTTTTQPTTTTTDTQVVDGQVIQTEWGPVQVEVTVSGSSIVDVEALQVPSHASRSRQINDYVVPLYRQAALKAQSANFWGISGATVTWWGYVNSMQSALDAAGF